MALDLSVSRIFEETYGITARPGRKVQCPFCNNPYFFIKRDDSLGKCFHPPCGRFIIAHHKDHPLRHSFYGVLEGLYQDFHSALLELAQRPYARDAYQYLVHERKIHPQVVADSMLGIVPTGYVENLEVIWKPLFDDAQAAIDAAKAERTRGRPPRVKGFSPEEWMTFLETAREKLRECLMKHAGWLCFFYTDAYHRIVAIRFRQPYSRNFVYWKPFDSVAGLFGHGLFAPTQDVSHQHLNDLLIATEGEFNSLQLQSLFVRQVQGKGKPEWSYLFACSVGGVQNADFRTLQRIAKAPIIGYDHDVNEAGGTFLNNARLVMSVTAFTTPSPHKDLDAYIRSFGHDDAGAWEAVKRLVANRQPYYRIYSGTGQEFLRGRTFIPKRLGDAIMERHRFKYAVELLWVYRDGIYRPEGEQAVKQVAQELLGDERRQNRVEETLRYIETATYSTPPTPDPDYINVRNGRLEWRTKRLHPHTPDVFEVVQLPVIYAPDAGSPVFDTYLKTTLVADVIPLVEEIMGYDLIPDTRHEKGIMFTGEGENGKSVLLDTIKALLGAENVSNVALHDLEENRFRVAELFGKLANIFADLDARALRSSSMFKTLVTGDPITAERKFGQPFTFSNYARLLFSANRLPPSSDRTHAFYRRWLIVPFEQTFTGKAADKKLRAKLQAELSGILNRALAGLHRLFEQDAFTEPQAVKDALAAYQRENDTVAAFTAECVKEEPLGKVLKQYFYKVYRTWCDLQGLKAVSQSELKTRLYQHFPKLDEARTARNTGPWHWLGIVLTEDAPPVKEEETDQDKTKE
jgi:P4 family phage/plasmid primase-like protien